MDPSLLVYTPPGSCIATMHHSTISTCHQLHYFSAWLVSQDRSSVHLETNSSYFYTLVYYQYHNNSIINNNEIWFGASQSTLKNVPIDKHKKKKCVHVCVGERGELVKTWQHTCVSSTIGGRVYLLFLRCEQTLCSSVQQRVKTTGQRTHHLWLIWFNWWCGGYFFTGCVD